MFTRRGACVLASLGSIALAPTIRHRSLNETNSDKLDQIRRSLHSIESTIHSSRKQENKPSGEIPSYTALIGTVVHSLDLSSLQIIKNGAIVYDANTGIIKAVINLGTIQWRLL